MAQAPSNDDFDSSGVDCLIQLPERDITELLLRLIASVGEIEKLKEERDQLQHQLYQTGNDGIRLGSDIEDSSRTGKRPFQDDQTNMSTSRTVPDDRQRMTARKQTQISGSGGLTPLRETDLPANKSHITNPTDSGMGSGSDICSNVSKPRKREQESTAMPDCCFLGSIPNIFGPRGFETSENIDVSSVTSNEQFKQLNKSNDAEMKIECDGAVGYSSLLPAVEDVFGSQMGYMGSPQTLQRTTSSRQDDQTSDKRKSEMKKTGSHDSYFPAKDKNNRDLPLQQSAKPVYWQRKSSYPAMSFGNTAEALETTDSLMISCLPQVASKTILNGVSRELRRVRKEYHRLEQREEEMKGIICQLKVELKDLKTKLEEMEKASEDARKNRVDDDHMVELNDLYRELKSVQAQYENEKRLHASVEQILTDERARFTRDEEHWKKQVERLKKQL